VAGNDGRIRIAVEPDLKSFPGKLQSGLRGAAGIAGSVGKGIGLALAAGTALAGFGLKSVIDIGTQYQGKLNELQAVTGATGMQMQQVSKIAKALGSDMTLPATSAADAAAAMLELSKGGLSVADSMKAAKGTLQLAAAAEIDAADAAEIQSQALNQFGLSAGSATHVADVLANTANAASGTILDIAGSMKYVGPVARSLKIDIDSTAAAIGLLANNGIQSEQAGTSLRAILASLAAPSKSAAKAMKTLSIEAFDQHGKFVGLRSITEQLSTAKKHLTDQEFANAAATAFGNESLSAVNALANSGTTAFDSMAVAVSKQGGAANVAAAKTKGLGGAIEGFKSQVETTKIGIYEAIAPNLEKATRAASTFVANFTPTITNGIQTAVSVGEVFIPRIAQAITSRASQLADAGRHALEPLVSGIKDAVNEGINIGITAVRGFGDVVREAADQVEPLVVGVGHVVQGFSKAGGPLGAFRQGLELAYDVASGIVSVVAPVVGLVGHLASAFSDLPGPIQSAAIALVALKVGPSVIGKISDVLKGAGRDADDAGKKTGLLGKAFTAVTLPARAVASGISGVVGTVRQFNGEAKLQQTLIAQSGIEMGRLRGYVNAYQTSAIPAVAVTRDFANQTMAIRDGAAAAGQPINLMSAAVGTLVERSPALSAMREAFNNAASGATRFSKLAGSAAAAGSLLKSAGSGIVGALGGPFGVVVGAATLGLGLLASANEDAAAKERQHQANINDLAGALRESHGVITSVIRGQFGQKLVDQYGDAANGAKTLGIGLDEVTTAALKQGNAYDVLHSRLEQIIKDHTIETRDPSTGQLNEQMDQTAETAQTVKFALEDMGKETDAARQKNADLAAAVAAGRASYLDATDAGHNLSAAMGVLADTTSSADEKSRALKEALDSLSGGSINLEAAQSRLNEQVDNLVGGFDGADVHAKGFAATLIDSNGKINTTTDQGRKLFNGLQDIGTSMTDVMQKTFDLSQAQGDTLPVSLNKAKAAGDSVLNQLVAQAKNLGLTETQVRALAKQYGLVPDDVVTLIQSPGMTDTQRELIILAGLVNQVPGNKPITVRSLSDEAKKKLIDLGFTVRTLPDGRVQVSANTKTAKQQLNDFVNQKTTKAVYVVYHFPSAGPLSSRATTNQYHGGIVKRFAEGGFHKLTPMRPIAQMVSPNTWRVVGDRLDVPEAYIPLKRSLPRSHAVLAESARAMGYALTRRFAEGGVAVSGRSAAQSLGGSAPTIINNTTVRENEDAYVAATVLSREVGRQLRKSHQ
jgi:TP901 family phage tail tape measure protein